VSALPGDPLRPERVVTGTSALRVSGLRADVRRDGGDALLPPAHALTRDRADGPDRAAAGSLRAAEEQTSHNYETIAGRIRRLGNHAEAVTEILVHDLELSEVEVDELCLV
jgi:hypothetical protein